MKVLIIKLTHCFRTWAQIENASFDVFLLDKPLSSGSQWARVSVPQVLSLSLEEDRKLGCKLLPGTCRGEKNLHSFEGCLATHRAFLKCSHSVLTALG